MQVAGGGEIRRAAAAGFNGAGDPGAQVALGGEFAQVLLDVIGYVGGLEDL